MSAAPRRSPSVRAILLWMAAGMGLLVAGLGVYAVVDLQPAARALSAHAELMAQEYDSLRLHASRMEAALGDIRRLTAKPGLTRGDHLQVGLLHAAIAALARQTAGVQANLLLSGIPADMRIALAEAAGMESHLSGVLSEALVDLDQGDRTSAQRWVVTADATRELLDGRLVAAQRLGLVDLAERERVLGARASRLGQGVAVWLVLGTVLVGLGTLVMHRRLYAPLAALDRGLARVAAGDLQASLAVEREDELGRLTAHFNEMTSVLRARPEVEALQRSEERFRSVYENTTIGLYRTTPDGRIVLANPALTRMLGYETFEALARRDLEAEGYEPDYPRSEFRRRLEDEGQVLGMESAWTRADGSIVWVRESAKVVRDSEGRALYYDGTVEDVTERRQAEDTLHREQYLMRALMDYVPDSIYFKDARSHFIRVNRALAERVGLTDPVEAVGKSDADFFARDHADAALSTEHEIMRTGQPELNLEEMETRPGGGSAWVSTTKMPLRDDTGTIIGTFGISRDITERKVSQLALQKSQESFARIFRLAPVAISISAVSDGRLLDVNEAFERLLGFGRDEVVGRTTREIGVWENPADREALLSALADRGELRDYALRLLTRERRLREVRGAFQIMELGGQSVLLATFTDVTEGLQAERALLASETRFRTAFMTVSDAHYIATREEGRILEVNDRFGDVFGYERAEVIGRTSRELGLWADIGDRERMLAELRSKGVVRNLEVIVRRKGGETIPVLMSVGELQSGDQPLILGVIRDVSEQKRAGEALRSLEEQFRQAQRLEAVGRLAGGVAHDFNNILTAITGYSDLLLEDFRPNDPRRADLEEIKTAARRAATLTRQLLAFSRKQVLQPQLLDLNEVIGALEKMLQRLIGEDVKLVLAPGKPLGTVRADPGQIEQVILNLVVNARDAMPHGGVITLETGNAELHDTYATGHGGAVPGPYVMLAVSDTGTGMDTETQSHIFEPFFTTKELGKGTGLGLATVHGVVTQSGGHVVVESEPGQGSKFRVYLPAVAPRTEAPQAVPAAQRSAGGSETVLLAEDDRAVREVVAAMLAQKGYSVLRAPDGQTALDMARAHTGEIHLLLSDIVMPGMTGRELAEALTADHPGLRVLYMSGYADDAAVRRGVLEEGLPFLQKPFTPEALATKVRELLDAPPRTAATGDRR